MLERMYLYQKCIVLSILIFFSLSSLSAVDIQKLEKAAENPQQTTLQYKLGLYYWNKKNTSNQPSKAKYWFEKAALSQHNQSMFYLYKIHLNGINVEPSEINAIRWLKKAANNQYAKAQYTLAMNYTKGRGVPKSDTLAIKWLNDASKNGHLDAKFELAKRYESDQYPGIKQNIQKARDIYSWLARKNHIGGLLKHAQYIETFSNRQQEALKFYEIAAAKGSSFAQYHAGRLFISDKGVPVDYTKAKKWFEKAALKGHAAAQNNLGVLYSIELSSLEKSDQAFELYKSSAEQGNAYGQYNLGMTHLKNLITQAQLPLAFKWLKLSSEQDHAPAQYQLGIMYQEGVYVEQNDTKALELIQQAAEQGNAKAQYQMALRYEQGRGVTKNLEQALTWYKKVAEQSDLTAQVKVAAMYEQGQGVDQNFTQAAKWYEKAAEQHHRASQIKLAALYEIGRGVSVNLNKAFYWYNQAAALHDTLAQYHLGRFYENGLGVEKNLSFAIDWYQKAMHDGSLLAHKALDKIYHGDIPYRVTAENKNILVCPEGYSEHPDTHQCVNSFKAHMNDTGVIFVCNASDKNLKFDPQMNTCFKEVYLPFQYQQCREGYTFNDITHHCERGAHTYTMSCPNGYTHTGYGRCAPEWDYRDVTYRRNLILFRGIDYIIDGNSSYWYDNSYTEDYAGFRGSFLRWDGRDVFNTGYVCGHISKYNGKKCSELFDYKNGYVYARGSNSPSVVKKNVSDWHKNTWFGRTHIDQYHVQEYYPIKRKKTHVKDKRCSYGHTQQGLTCIRAKQTYMPAKVCEKGQLSLDESSCHYEHREQTVVYSFDDQEHIIDGQKVKPLPELKVHHELLLHTPDDLGISTLELSDLDVEGQIIEINNNPDTNEHLEYAASVVILQAQASYIDAQFKITGDQADVILIHDQKLDCKTCRFIHAPRVVLATGTVRPDFENEKLSIRVSQGDINISGEVKADTSALLDILTPQLRLRPDTSISTNFQGYQVDKEIQRHPQGQLEFGSGQLQILLGNFDYDYVTSKVNKVRIKEPYRSLFMEYGSRIDAGRIKIQSLGEKANMLIDGLISAQSDATFIQNYLGAPVIGDEVVDIDSLDKIYLDGFIEAGQYIKLNSGGAIDIDIWDHQYTSQNDLSGQEKSQKRRIQAAYPLKNNLLSKDIYITSLQDIRNQGTLSAGNLYIDSSNFYNEGIMKAKGEMAIQTQDLGARLENRFGGILSAANMALKSDYLVRNGSPFNFRQEPLREQPLHREKRFYGPVIDVGTIHRYEKKAYYEKVKRATANIYAQRLSIESTYVENVNPYEMQVFHKGPENRIFYNGDFDNTAIMVERDMTVKASENFINGSAILRAGHNLKVSASEFHNERYHLRIETECGFMSGLDQDKQNVSSQPIAQSECTQAVLDYHTRHPEQSLTTLNIIAESEDVKVIDSPAGRIFVGQDLEVTSDILGNSMGFLEVFNNFTATASDPQINTYTLNKDRNFLSVHRAWGECTASYQSMKDEQGAQYCYRSHYATHRDNPLFSAVVVGGSLNVSGNQDFKVQVLNRTDAYGQPHENKKLSKVEEARKFQDQQKL